MAAYQSSLHTFTIDDLTGTFSGLTYADDPTFLDVFGNVVEPFVDKDGYTLYGIDSEFGFNVTDFLGAEAKTLDGDYGEGFAGNAIENEEVIGIAVRNSPTDLFLSGSQLGTWSLGLGGQTVKASTEHYNVMADVLSDQAYADDPDAIGPLDNDLRILDRRPTGPDGALEAGPTHDLWVEELLQALQTAIDDAGDITDAGDDTFSTYSDIDFDRDGVNDEYTTMAVEIQYDLNDDGVAETVNVGGVDLDGDGTADMTDRFLNGFGTEADITDLMEPNEATVTYDIAYSSDYSVTVKDDGKLLYRFGEAVKKPNDIRMEVNMELPEEWTQDLDSNGVADGLDGMGFTVTSAKLVITHAITNNPNDQVRPEDYENEAAIGRLPSYYVVKDPDDATNILWVSPRDSYTGAGEFLPSYFRLTESGAVDMVAQTGDISVFDPDGVLVGYRNKDDGGEPIGTVYKDESLIDLNAAANLSFMTTDIAEGFTPEWYITVDREPFEWSYDTEADNPYINVFESFRTPEEAALAGFTEDDLVSGPRWRLTPNKFGQDLPGLEVPLNENSKPPYQNNNIKYETGELTTTTLNLLDWAGDSSPFDSSLGWMAVDPTRIDVNKDGLIDEGWADVTTLGGSFGAGDAVPTDLILSAVTPNGTNLTSNFFDAAIYVKGDRQDSANLYDMQLLIEFDVPGETIVGTTGNDTLIGTSGDDIISGLEGNDTLFGREGDDTLDGGSGIDWLYGEEGADSFVFAPGSDFTYVADFEDGVDKISVSGFTSSDLSITSVTNLNGVQFTKIQATDGSKMLLVETDLSLIDGSDFEGVDFNQTITGDANSNTLIGGIGDDDISGLAGNDRLYGRAGNDTLDGGSGNDWLYGEEGDDSFVFAPGSDYTYVADFEDGMDRISVSGFTQSDLSITSVTNLAGVQFTKVQATDGSKMLLVETDVSLITFENDFDFV